MMNSIMKMNYKLPGPKSKAMLERGIPLFRNGLRYEEECKKAARRGYRGASQVVVGRAQGSFVWDLDDNQYIDFQNGWASNPFGNAHPEIVEAVHWAHTRYGFHYDTPHRYELAEKLVQIMPNRALTRINFEISGTEAAEAAVNLALTHTKRRYIISFSSSFHGEALGSKMLSGTSNNNHYMEAWSGGVITAPYPYSGEIPAGMTQEQYVEYCLWYIDNHITSSIVPANNIAGLIIEPGLAEGGNWIPPKRFMQGLRELCNKHDWVMIVDEVLTGLGRTGKMWAIEHYDVIPDVLVFGKNISGGIEPCAGIAARDEIMGDNEHYHTGSTYAGSPAACCAGLKTLELYERENIVEYVAYLGEIAKGIMQKWTRYSIVNEVRCNGLLLGVNFVSPDEHQKDWWFAREVRSRMMENGVWAINDRQTNVRLYPALNMEESVLREGLAIMEEAIAHVDSIRQSSFGDSPAWPTGDAGF
ncbi:aminotransferase [Shewanella amazonensis SB2B]|uniref:Aminotransferase n=1 Tax=Shewanella amazonensis (strain ATCC BAA-1098 / SB2B) TaxID=326297 RepID=A1SBQ2_SHEAM|nr:aminotransferase class III-fold pyridoxal phosphate-dependent enzyme [Shewanella amazonensis]ABM01809.1 aminotransferase [Shewanella amazonensis SB2B]